MKKQTEKQLAVVTGLTAALAASSGAATVQITLTGNRISSTGGNQLSADITGDGTSDVTFRSFIATSNRVNVRINGANVYGFLYGILNYVRAGFASGGVGVRFSSTRKESPANIKYLNPVTFTDARINGGAATNGYLEINSIAAGRNMYSVALTRVVFDDASTARPTVTSTSQQFTEFSPVPEPGSLALLALGAGGLLIRRQRKAA